MNDTILFRAKYILNYSKKKKKESKIKNNRQELVIKFQEKRETKSKCRSKRKNQKRKKSLFVQNVTLKWIFFNIKSVKLEMPFSTMLRQIKSKKKSEEKREAERELVSLAKEFKKTVIIQKKGTSSRFQWAWDTLSRTTLWTTFSYTRSHSSALVSPRRFQKTSTKFEFHYASFWRIDSRSIFV